jgi:hypothetical protein
MEPPLQHAQAVNFTMKQPALYYFLWMPLFIFLFISCSFSSQKNANQLTLRDQLLYYKTTLFSGTRLEYYPTGILYKETEYRKGIKEGQEKTYSINGKIKSLSYYKEGKKDGLFEGMQTEWHQNGKIFRQIEYESGVEKSKKILYSDNRIYSNYLKQDGRIYGQDGGPLCFEKKKDGEKEK